MALRSNARTHGVPLLMLMLAVVAALLVAPASSAAGPKGCQVIGLEGSCNFITKTGTVSIVGAGGSWYVFWTSKSYAVVCQSNGLSVHVGLCGAPKGARIYLFAYEAAVFVRDVRL